jgi:hypothetical protein
LDAGLPDLAGSDAGSPDAVGVDGGQPDGGPSQCGERSPNALLGSISEVFPDIDAVDKTCARLQTSGGGDEAVVLEFFNGNNVVAKVIGEHANNFSRGVRFPIVTGDVSRVTAPPTDYPGTILMGAMEIDSDLVVGADFNACFDVLFDATGTADNTQRTLSGAISTTLQPQTSNCQP